MAEFFVAIGFVQILFFGWLISRYTSRLVREQELEEFVKEDEIATKESQNEAKIIVVARSVDDVVCRYNDLVVYRYVKLSDDRTFIFESVAVQKSPDVYHADFPNSKYIIVDQCLLYREVPVE